MDPHPRLSIRNSRQGYTLVEFLVAGGIMVILMTLIAQMFVATVELRLESQAEGAVERDARYLLSRLTYDLARADEVVVPTNAGESGSSLQLTIGGETYSYTLNGGNLQLVTPTDDGQLNSNGTKVTGLTFTKLAEVDGPTSVRIELQLESVAETVRGVKDREIVTTVRIR